MQVIIENVSAPIFAALERRAKKHDVSVDEEAKTLLLASLVEEAESPAEAFRILREAQLEARGGEYFSDSVEIIRGSRLNDH